MHASVNKLAYIARALSQDGLITALECSKSGVFVIASQALEKGRNVMECTAASIALDPSFRRGHCGFCAKQYPNPKLCEKCQVVGACEKCLLERRHESECAVLQAVADVCPEQESGEPNFDSHYLLTIRLLCQHENIDWDLAKCLHYRELPSEIDTDIIAVCARINVVRSSSNLKGVTLDAFKFILGRVIACSHAITDVSLPIGSQFIGHGLFLEHSFYNHSCTPNAFLSCDLMTDGHARIEHRCGVLARLHLLSDVQVNEHITISYVPTSGLGFQERQQRLLEGYDFTCDCDACDRQVLRLEPNTDVESIREIQCCCNQTMLNALDSSVDVEEIEHIVALVEMTRRGIQNQEIPASHEVSIESDRLLAMAFTLLGKNDKAVFHHRSYLSKAKQIEGLFDPVAMATQLLTYANIVADPLRTSLLHEALSALSSALGKAHPWIQTLFQELDITDSNDLNPKKRKAFK